MKTDYPLKPLGFERDADHANVGYFYNKYMLIKLFTNLFRHLVGCLNELDTA